MSNDSESQVVEHLKAQIQALESSEQIRQLKALAMYHADRQDAEAFAGLFCEDGVFIGVTQEHRGRQAIAKNLNFLPFAVHYIMNPIISVSGDRADARWYTLRPQVDRTGVPSWTAGWYDDEYVRIAGEWRFKSVTIKYCFHSPYNTGWSKDRVVAPEPISAALGASLARSRTGAVSTHVQHEKVTPTRR